MRLGTTNPMESTFATVRLRPRSPAGPAPVPSPWQWSSS
ncbi:hypothetical protein [Streptomyces sp. NPDC017102]